MGHTRHHAIIVTGSTDLVDDARAKALELFAAEQVTPIIISPVNAYHTFLIGPDGSKEGWESSNDGDDARSAFTAWLSSCWVAWAEVQYGDGDGINRLVAASGVG